MLTRVRISNFQSLKTAELELGRVTVVIGPSNSGKSAVLRSIGMVAHNIGSPKDVVTHGATATAVSLTVDDRVVEITRGKSRSTYAIDGDEYPKAGTTVPEKVAEILRFVEIEGEDLNYTTQFDLPLLLGAPPTTAAKVLGDLTNVTRIFDAVREANRRLLEVNKVLKVRQVDRDRLVEEVQKYRTLPAEIASVESARALLALAKETDHKAQGLLANITVVEQATLLAERLRAEPEVTVPDVDKLVGKLHRVQAIQAVVQNVKSYAELAETARADVARIEQEIANTDVEFHTMLKEAGTCPLCGAKTK